MSRNCSPSRPRSALHAFAVDATQHDSVVRLFAAVTERLGDIDVVAYNAGARLAGSLVDLDAGCRRAGNRGECHAAAFFVAQQAAMRMVPRGHGAILFTGATASIKGFANSAAFAMGKFALRGLAQSAARELGPKGIHVAHFIIDGAVRSADRPDRSRATRQHPRSRCDCAELLECAAPAAQRLVAGDRPAPLGRAILTIPGLVAGR